MGKLRYVDLDGTLAYFYKWEGLDIIGAPVPEMIEKVKAWVKAGDDIIIFTARLGPSSEQYPKNDKIARQAIESWCLKYFDRIFPITSTKASFDVGYDDKIHYIIKNSGLTSEEFLLKRIKAKRDCLTDTDTLNFVVKYLHSIIKGQN